MDNFDGKPTDDIFALFSRFDLDISNYKVFERESPAPVDPVTVIHKEQKADSYHALASALSAAQLLATPPAADAPEHVAEPSEIDSDRPHRLVTPIPSRIPERARELTPVLRHRRTPEPRRRSQTGECCIQVFGAAGGVGVTTLVATLSHYLSHEGYRCGVYGGSKPGILPLFYGSRSAAAPLGRFGALRALYQSSIQLLPPAGLPGHEARSQMQESELLQTASVQCGVSLNTLLIDNGSQAVSQGPGLRICVATPDVASVFGVKQFLTDTQHTAPAICVLNRFEADNALHAEVRAWFADHFSTLLTISNSHLVAEALAEGCCILDWCPETLVALDFTRVGEAVTALSVTSETHVQEIALCS